MMLTGLVLSIQPLAAPCPDALAHAKLTLLYFADITDPRKDMQRHYASTEPDPHSFFPCPHNPTAALSFDSWIPSSHPPKVPASRAVLGAQPAPVTPVAFCCCLGCCFLLFLLDSRGQHIHCPPCG